MSNNNRFVNAGNIYGENYPLRIDFDGEGKFEFIDYEMSSTITSESDSNTETFKKQNINDNGNKITTNSSPSYSISIEGKYDYTDPAYINLSKAVKDKKQVYFEIYDVIKEQSVVFGTAVITEGDRTFNASEMATSTFTLNVQGELHQRGVNDKFIIKYIPGPFGDFDEQVFEAEYLDNIYPDYYFNGDGNPEPFDPEKYKFLGWNNLKADEVQKLKVKGDVTFEARFGPVGGGDTIYNLCEFKMYERTQDATGQNDKYIDHNRAKIMPILQNDGFKVENEQTIAQGLHNITGRSNLTLPALLGCKLLQIELYLNNKPEADKIFVGSAGKIEFDNYLNFTKVIEPHLFKIIYVKK